MILLDTNVLSALMRNAPDAVVARWLDRQPSASVWTTSITVFEIRFGLQSMVSGKRRTQLMSTFDLVMNEVIQQRIAPFDSAAAHETADLMAARRKRGRPSELRDTMIAGIALSSRATIATRNMRHFEDLSSPVVDPWTAS